MNAEDRAALIVSVKEFDDIGKEGDFREIHNPKDMARGPGEASNQISI